MGLFNAFISRKKFNSTTSHTSVLIVMGSQPYQASYLLNCILLKLPWNGSQWLAYVQFKSTIHHNTGTVHTHTTHRGWFTASIYFMKVIKDVPFLHPKKKTNLCVLWMVYCEHERCCWLFTRGHRVSVMCREHKWGCWFARKYALNSACCFFLVFSPMLCLNPRLQPGENKPF